MQLTEIRRVTALLQGKVGGWLNVSAPRTGKRRNNFHNTSATYSRQAELLYLMACIIG